MSLQDWPTWNELSKIWPYTQSKPLTFKRKLNTWSHSVDCPYFVSLPKVLSKLQKSSSRCRSRSGLKNRKLGRRFFCRFVGIYPFLRISSASGFPAWFMLQIVMAGKGISLMLASIGLKLTMTGLSDHLMYKTLMKYAAKLKAAINANNQKILPYNPKKQYNYSTYQKKFAANLPTFRTVKWRCQRHTSNHAKSICRSILVHSPFRCMKWKCFFYNSSII